MNVVVRVLLDLLEALFAVGAIGSGVVLMLTGIEDVRTVLEPEESPAPDQPQPPSE